MSGCRRDWWAERRRIQWKLKHGFKMTKEELSISNEIQEIVELLQVLRYGGTPEKGRSRIRSRAGKILCDLVFHLIQSKDELTGVKEIVSDLFDKANHLIELAGYSVIIEKVTAGRVSSEKCVSEFLKIWREKPERPERTITRLLSRDPRFIKIERNSFVSSEWPPSKLLQLYVRLASEYRLKNPRKKERFIREAIKLIESRKTDFPNVNALIQTLRRM